jgi:exopolysaccharide production protein ExoQ
MNEMLARVRYEVGVNRWAALLLVLAVAASVALGVSIAIRMGQLPLATGLTSAFVLCLLSLRWPLLPLFLLVALVPVEDAINVAGVGTLSKTVGILFAVVYGVPRLGRLTLRATPTAAWAYLAWAVLSLFWALDPNVAQAQLQTLVQLFAVAILVADVVVHDAALIRPLLWVYTLSAALTACIGVAGYGSGLTVDSGRVAALAGQDPAQFAALLLPALVFSLYELVQGRRLLTSSTVAMVCTIAIVLSGTRGAWVAAVVVVVVFIVPRLRPRRRVAAVMVVLSFLAVALQVPGAADLVGQRTALATATGGAGRTDIWTVGLTIFGSSPVTGVGYANFPVAYGPRLVATADVATSRGYGRAPHSIVIGTIGELGLIGLACLVLFLAPLALRRGWGPDAAVVQAILASLMISALFLDVLGNRKQVWLAIGLAAGLAYLGRRAGASTGRQSGSLEVGAPTTSAVGAALPSRSSAGTLSARLTGGHTTGVHTR